MPADIPEMKAAREALAEFDVEMEAYKAHRHPGRPDRPPATHLRAALARVDELEARLADLERLEASQHKARARDVAAIVGWLRRQRDGLYPDSPLRIAYANAADAIERGDWHDGILPPDPRDARIAELEAAAPRWVRRFDGAPWFLMVGTARLPGSGIVRHPTTSKCWETETCEEHPDEATAARAVCARLGLPEILTGLSGAAGVPTLYALSVCGDGQPGHPLMLPNSATPTPWRRP